MGVFRLVSRNMYTFPTGGIDYTCVNSGGYEWQDTSGNKFIYGHMPDHGNGLCPGYSTAVTSVAAVLYNKTVWWRTGHTDGCTYYPAICIHSQLVV